MTKIKAERLPERRCLHCNDRFWPANRKHLYCCERCRNLHFRGGAPKTNRRCSWCGKRLDEALRRDARFCDAHCRQDAFLARPCVYCGMAAGSRDHFIPTSFVNKMLSAGIVLNRAQVVVPCCLECNSTAGDKVFTTITDKRRFIQSRYRAKYAKVLDAPHWAEEELQELGFELQSRIRSGAEARDLVRRRLRWPRP